MRATAFVARGQREMQIIRQFDVARPRERVWALFQDVPRVATCIPGTRITGESGDGKYQGRVEVKLGPIATAFEGDATHEPDQAQWCGTIAGAGRDRAAGSRAKFSTRYVLREIAGGTQVAVESDIALSGAMAQFGRTGLIEEFITRMLQQFATNLEAELAGAPAADAADERPDVGAIFWSSLWQWLRTLVARLFGRARKKEG